MLLQRFVYKRTVKKDNINIQIYTNVHISINKYDFDALVFKAINYVNKAKTKNCNIINTTDTESISNENYVTAIFI